MERPSLGSSWPFLYSLAEEDEQLSCEEARNPGVHTAGDPAHHQVPRFSPKNPAVHQRWASFSSALRAGAPHPLCTRDPTEELFPALVGLRETLGFYLKTVGLNENLKYYVGGLRVDDSKKGRNHLLMPSRAQGPE